MRVKQGRGWVEAWERRPIVESKKKKSVFRVFRDLGKCFI